MTPNGYVLVVTNGSTGGILMSFVNFADRPLRTREEIAREVHAVALRRSLDELATVIALMTISTEVGANDRNGVRQWWCPFNRSDPQTEQFAHDSESDDSLSSGYFQQQVSRPGAPGRPWGWGGLFGDANGARKRMSLQDSADMFLAALASDYTRASGNPQLAGEFAQRVQRSAFPDRYSQKWDEAWAVLRRALDQGPATPAPSRSDTAVATVTGDPVWLEEVLRPVLGDRLRTLPGWQTSGHGDFADIRGVMVHHTGNSRESADSIRRGRPDLAGPLANLHIAPDGVVTIVAVGVCWHAGRGSYPWLPTNNANQHMIGIECAWPTIGRAGSFDRSERWPDPQIISMRDTCAALALKLGVPATRVIGHKEYAGAAQGKWDPGNIDMSWFRGEIAKDMRGEFDQVPVVVPPPDPVEPPRLPAPPNPRSDRQLLEDIWTALRGPEGNGWPQLGGRSVVDCLADLLGAPRDVTPGLGIGERAPVRPVKAPAKKALSKVDKATAAAKKAAAKKAAAKKAADGTVAVGAGT